MKSFKNFLTESTKTYKFKVKVAGDLPEGFDTKLKNNMQKFDVVSISSGKKTPITKTPLDFPKLANLETYTFEVEVKYPTTSQVLTEYLAANCSVPRSHLLVRGEFDPIEEIQNQPEESEYQTKLTTEDMGGESAQDSVGNNRVMDLLKELETARKEREIDPMQAAPKGESKDIDMKEQSKSPVGS